MTFVTRGGKILIVDGALTNNPECCCEECDCPNCDVCPYCCIEFAYFEIYWTECECNYLSFHHNPATGGVPECEPDPTTTCEDDNKGRYWTSSCTYELPGFWRCIIEGAGDYAGCGKIQVKIVDSTTLEVTVIDGPNAGTCDSGDCTNEINETITIDLTSMYAGSTTSVCLPPATPSEATDSDGLSGTNGCVGQVLFEWDVFNCCSSITTDCESLGGDPDPGDGGGDPDPGDGGGDPDPGDGGGDPDPGDGGGDPDPGDFTPGDEGYP